MQDKADQWSEQQVEFRSPWRDEPTKVVRYRVLQREPVVELMVKVQVVAEQVPSSGTRR